jgi:hypothetical protein
VGSTVKAVLFLFQRHALVDPLGKSRVEIGVFFRP